MTHEYCDICLTQFPVPEIGCEDTARRQLVVIGGGDQDREKENRAVIASQVHYTKVCPACIQHLIVTVKELRCNASSR